MKRVGTDASPAAVGRLAAEMARAAMTPATRILALGALRTHWAPTAVGRPPAGAADRSRTGGDYVDALGRLAAAVRFVREPLAIGEVVQAPWRTLAYMAGDCDDLACCIAALAAVVGLPAAVAIRVSGDSAHAVALVGDRWDGPTGRLTHVIDQDGAKVAPSDILHASTVFPVSLGE